MGVVDTEGKLAGSTVAPAVARPWRLLESLGSSPAAIAGLRTSPPLLLILGRKRRTAAAHFCNKVFLQHFIDFMLSRFSRDFFVDIYLFFDNILNTVNPEIEQTPELEQPPVIEQPPGECFIREKIKIFQFFTRL
jgi:hypothetical protein